MVLIPEDLGSHLSLAPLGNLKRFVVLPKVSWIEYLLAYILGVVIHPNQIVDWLPFFLFQKLGFNVCINFIKLA